MYHVLQVSAALLHYTGVSDLRNYASYVTVYLIHIIAYTDHVPDRQPNAGPIPAPDSRSLSPMGCGVDKFAR